MSLLLTGCDTFSLLRDQRSPTLSRRRRQAFDKPGFRRADRHPADAERPGVCHDYHHRLPNGTVTPFYVGFRNSDGKVVAFGPTTCGEAQANGNLNSDEPIKQRF
ncbi:hypothetical protein M5585_21625 [Serratia ureilytica]